MGLSSGVGWCKSSRRPIEVADGNGHHDEADEPQQTLFSWAEFMAEEPEKPKRRGRKPQPASMSMFEWALEMEQEREKEPAGTAS